MKKISLLPVLLILFIVNINTVSASDNANKFYKSPADYKSNKPIENISIVDGSWRIVMSSESLEVEKNGVKERIKVTALPSSWYTNGSGMLMRVDDGRVYYVVIEGPLCYYIKRSEGWVSYDGPGKFYFSRPMEDDFAPKDYYSESITGEIKKLKDKDLDVYLEKYNLVDQYNDEKIKRERKDKVDDYITKGKNKIAKYIVLINEKMK